MIDRSGAVTADEHRAFCEEVRSVTQPRDGRLVWTREDSKRATAEGWDVFSHYGPEAIEETRIERIDCPENEAGEFVDPILDDDAEAWELVAEGASKGSELHTKALAIISSAEAARIADHWGQRIRVILPETNDSPSQEESGA